MQMYLHNFFSNPFLFTFLFVSKGKINFLFFFQGGEVVELEPKKVDVFDQVLHGRGHSPLPSKVHIRFIIA